MFVQAFVVFLSVPLFEQEEPILHPDYSDFVLHAMVVMILLLVAYYYFKFWRYTSTINAMRRQNSVFIPVWLWNHCSGDTQDAVVNLSGYHMKIQSTTLNEAKIVKAAMKHLLSARVLGVRKQAGAGSAAIMSLPS